MVGSAQVHDLGVFAEPPKGTRGGPSDRPGAPETGRGRIVDLSHPIRDGLITYPGLPGPELRPYLTREQSRERYAPGTEFQIDAVTMVGNTGTYLDSPRRAPGLGQLPPTGFGFTAAPIPFAGCGTFPSAPTRRSPSNRRAVMSSGNRLRPACDFAGGPAPPRRSWLGGSGRS
jgi:hypothetical protein